MSLQATNDAERKIRAAFDAQRLEAAASATLEAYGDQIFSFIAARLRSHSAAQDTFSVFVEDLWVGLPSFSWRCSMRTWCYTLARNAATRVASAPARRRDRNIPLSRPSIVPYLAEATRTATRAYQQTVVKDRFRALREQLDPEDQMLLVLRVDREMSWADLALTMLGDVDAREDAIAREAARLRKAFERLKDQLKRLAEREGLLDSGCR